MQNERRDGFEIDLQKLLLTYLSKWWLFVIGMVVVAMLAFWFTNYFITPMYRASVTVYVNNIKRGEQITYLSGTNLTASQQLVNTYIQMINSDTVLTKVADTSGLGLSAGSIRSMMSANQVDDTELFKFFITHPDPQQAAKIANAIAEVAPGEIENFVEGSSAKIIDYAKVPAAPSSPNVSKNCALGALIGIMLVLVYVTIRFLMDVRIKDEEDLNALFEIPVLGQIPVFVAEGSRRKGSYYEKSGYDTAAKHQKGDAK